MLEFFSLSIVFLGKQFVFQVTPWYLNYFWFFVFCSLIIWFLEIFFPWRKNQAKFRKGFWLDTFYLVFNFFVFPLIVLQPLSHFLLWSLKAFTHLQHSLWNVQSLPVWLQLIIFFVVLDFIQWLIHVCLHRFSILWRFHQVHHSVQEMGFAAHFRFHWMEHLIYTPAKYTMVVLLGGFEPGSIFIIHYLSILIGHLNHANLNLSYGFLRYFFNNPYMHIWHHAKDLPFKHRYGVNFGISLSIWDFLFKTAYIPKNGKDIVLGFEDIEVYPQNWEKQMLQPLKKVKKFNA